MDLTRSVVHLRTSASAHPKLPCCASQILFTAPLILLLPPVLLSETLNCDQLLFPCYSVASCTLGLEDEVLRNRFLCCLAAVMRAKSTCNGSLTVMTMTLSCLKALFPHHTHCTASLFSKMEHHPSIVFCTCFLVICVIPPK